MYKLVCESIKDSNQPARKRRMIRVFNERSMGSQGSNVSTGGKLRLWSDCGDAQTDLIHRCTQIPPCTLCWMPDLDIYYSRIAQRQERNTKLFIQLI